MKRIYCDWCGEDLGEGTPYPGDLESCGAPECCRAVRDMYREREDEARERAREDGYERYR